MSGRGLPTLDERATWRFEHDTFLRVGAERRAPGGRGAQTMHRRQPAGARASTWFWSRTRAAATWRASACSALRKAFGKQGWTFAAVTLGSPHLGTHVFERVGHRWHGLAAAVGGLRDLGAPWMNRDTLAELVNLERGLAYDVPPGFHDVEPAGVDRMMRGRPATELPEGLWLVGSHWGRDAGVEERAWDWLFEDVIGAEEEGDGLVRRLSALGGRVAGRAMLARRAARCSSTRRRCSTRTTWCMSRRGRRWRGCWRARWRRGLKRHDPGGRVLSRYLRLLWALGALLAATARANGGCVPPGLASGRPALRGRHPCADVVGARAELAARCALRSDKPLRVSSRSALRAPPPPLRFLPPLNAIPDGTQPPFALRAWPLGQIRGISSFVRVWHWRAIEARQCPRPARRLCEGFDANGRNAVAWNGGHAGFLAELRHSV